METQSGVELTGSRDGESDLYVCDTDYHLWCMFTLEHDHFSEMAGAQHIVFILTIYRIGKTSM